MCGDADFRKAIDLRRGYVHDHRHPKEQIFIDTVNLENRKDIEGDRMNTVQRIAKNTGVLLASQVVSYVIGFFFVMYTARYLGAEGFGILSFALAFTGIFGVFADLGLRQLTVREVARDKSLAGKYLGNIAAMKVILVTAAR